MGYFESRKKSGFPGTIVTWADGTDEEIAAMLQAHYDGKIDIHDYWTVGDERTVSLSAMSATGVGESHVAQDVVMVLMHAGGKELTTSINGHTECAFIVGQKDCLYNGSNTEYGYMGQFRSDAQKSWHASVRREWCNSIYKNAIPSTLRDIFKQYKNITATNGSTMQGWTDNDYFALLDYKEVIGINYYDYQSDLIQFDYYKDTSHRIKKVNSNNSWYYWLRTPYIDSSPGKYWYINSSGGAGSGYCDQAIAAFAPFGVI